MIRSGLHAGHIAFFGIVKPGTRVRRRALDTRTAAKHAAPCAGSSLHSSFPEGRGFNSRHTSTKHLSSLRCSVHPSLKLKSPISIACSGPACRNTRHARSSCCSRVCVLFKLSKCTVAIASCPCSMCAPCDARQATATTGSVGVAHLLAVDASMQHKQTPPHASAHAVKGELESRTQESRVHHDDYAVCTPRHVRLLGATTCGREHTHWPTVQPSTSERV